MTQNLHLKSANARALLSDGSTTKLFEVLEIKNFVCIY